MQFQEMGNTDSHPKIVTRTTKYDKSNRPVECISCGGEIQMIYRSKVQYVCCSCGKDFT